MSLKECHSMDTVENSRYGLYNIPPGSSPASQILPGLCPTLFSAHSAWSPLGEGSLKHPCALDTQSPPPAQPISCIPDPLLPGHL